MAIPYNPSSFATNKTILQAIEELKNYLKDNPCYKIYYVNTAYVVGTTTYNLSDVDDPDDTMTEYDVVIFTNSYYASVINKDTNTFDIDPAVSFKGATGQAGADGQDGVSVVGATINASNHLIITLSDGNTIDAGEILSNFEIIEISNLYISGTITADEYTKLKGDSVIVKRGEYYFRKNRLYSSEQHVIYEVCTNANTTTTWIMSVDFTDSYTWSLSTNALKTKIQSSDIDSQTATSGQVLTADGNGSASWTTVSAGGYENTVSISSTSGTFTDSEFAKLGYGDSTIIYTDAYSVSTVYKLKLETASILEFEVIDAASKNNLKLIDVNKTSKAYSMTSVAMIKSATFDSGTATSGKVLTANGSGGCSWETAGGGSKYLHMIRVSNGTYFFYIFIYNSDNTSISAIATIGAYVYGKGYTNNQNQYTLCSTALMQESDGVTYGFITGVYSGGGTGLRIKYIKTDMNTSDDNLSSYTFTDTVITI